MSEIPVITKKQSGFYRTAFILCHLLILDAPLLLAFGPANDSDTNYTQTEKYNPQWVHQES